MGKPIGRREKVMIDHSYNNYTYKANHFELKLPKFHSNLESPSKRIWNMACIWGVTVYKTSVRD